MYILQRPNNDILIIYKKNNKAKPFKLTGDIIYNSEILLNKIGMVLIKKECFA